MYKQSQRRFEYNINPQGAEEYERFSNKYSHNTRTPDYGTSTTTPINKRASINYSMHEDRDRSIQDNSFQGGFRNEEKYQPRGRISSETMIKRSTQRSANAPRNKNQYPQQSFKQTKKVYFGGEQGYRDFDSNQRPDRRTANRDQNKRLNGDEYSTHMLQENNNFSNLKGETNSLKPRKGDKQDQISDYGINQKEIMQKIGRINRLNEQINSRLQRMLNKIDGA